MENKTCPQCGTATEEDSRFCPTCGYNYSLENKAPIEEDNQKEIAFPEDPQMTNTQQVIDPRIAALNEEIPSVNVDTEKTEIPTIAMGAVGQSMVNEATAQIQQAQTTEIPLQNTQPQPLPTNSYNAPVQKIQREKKKRSALPIILLGLVLLLGLGIGGTILLAPSAMNSFMSNFGITTHFGEKQTNETVVTTPETAEPTTENSEESTAVVENNENNNSNSSQETTTVADAEEEKKEEEETSEQATPIPQLEDDVVLGTITVNVDKLLRRSTPVYDTSKKNVRNDPRHATKGATYDVYDIVEDSGVTFYRIDEDVWVGNPNGENYITFKEN